MEIVTDFTFLGSKITVDSDCSHEIIRCLLLGRKAMTNLDNILKSRDIILPSKVHLGKAMVFPVVLYGCESWNIKKAENQRIYAFELRCWRRLLAVLIIEQQKHHLEQYRKCHTGNNVLSSRLQYQNCVVAKHIWWKRKLLKQTFLFGLFPFHLFLSYRFQNTTKVVKVFLILVSSYKQTNKQTNKQKGCSQKVLLFCLSLHCHISAATGGSVFLSHLSQTCRVKRKNIVLFQEKDIGHFRKISSFSHLYFPKLNA